ncbi:MAG: hypothetical protein LBE13_17080 [Bacteroidales bacterium]|jgi:hypothetical protein|nr:hypothetical protein [Bacteroidales bacterium]
MLYVQSKSGGVEMPNFAREICLPRVMTHNTIKIKLEKPNSVTMPPFTFKTTTLNVAITKQRNLFQEVNLHVYHYAGNNPVKYIDPTGRSNRRKGVDLNLFSPDEPLHYPMADTVPHPRRTFIVAGHGNNSRIADERRRGIMIDPGNYTITYTGEQRLFTPEQLAEMITERGSGYREGDMVILISCETGKETRYEDVQNFAQVLADALGPGAIVKAPDVGVSVLEAGKVYLLYDDGSMVVTDENYSHFKTFIGRDPNNEN